jgi:aminopeptidase N
MKSFIVVLILILFTSGFAQLAYHHGNKSGYTNIISTTGAAYDVLEYRLEINILPEKKSIAGRNTIFLKTLEQIDEIIEIDFIGLNTDSVESGGQKLNFSQTANTLQIEIPQAILSGDTVQFDVYYHGEPDKGLYFRQNSFGDTVIYSHSEPFDARYWIPCKDDPADKVLLETRITLPEKYIVLGNGVKLEEIVSPSGLRTTIWRETYPITTYLISIAAAPFHIVDRTYSWQQKMMPLQYYVYPQYIDQAEKGLVSSQKILDFFNTYIGDYPFFSEKYAMSAVPFREAAAMENQTATTMRDNIIDNEGVIAHELAHQWWGDALSPQTFGHIWLNEGFASYFDALFTEAEYGREAFLQQMSLYSSYIFQDGSLEYPILNPPAEYLFGRAVYFKGAWVLHMLRNLVGDATFQQINRMYYQLYNYANVDSDDFIQVCQNVSGQNLNWFFDQWLNYGGIPELFGHWEQRDDQVIISINQEQPQPVYQIPLEIRIVGQTRDTLFVLPVTSKNTVEYLRFDDMILRMEIDPENKILQRNNGPVFFIPSTTELTRMYPNPFNNTLSIEYYVNRPQQVMIDIYDRLGKQVTTLLNNIKPTGIHIVTWSARQHASGTYFIVLKAQNQTTVRKVLLLK